MSTGLFVLALGLCLLTLLALAFRVLPGERWQVLAALPWRRMGESSWSGLNLTWYGVLLASAFTFAVAVYALQLGALGASRWQTLAVLLGVTVFAVPSSRLVARIVERKQATLTVGGAVFVGLLMAPLVVVAVNASFSMIAPAFAPLPVVPALAAIAVAYTFGEGFGRLACVSFGCCYGKPVDHLRSAFWRRLLGPVAFVFQGPTRKVAYASGLAGVPLVPIQAVTAIVYVLTGLAGLAAFLEGHFAAAFVLSVTVSQGWRVWSETLRADYRGTGKVSAYQWMAAAGIVYAVVVITVVPASAVLPTGAPSLTEMPNLLHGLQSLWHPVEVLLLQALWLAMFRFTGCSEVTGSTIALHVHEDRV